MKTICKVAIFLAELDPQNKRECKGEHEMTAELFG